MLYFHFNFSVSLIQILSIFWTQTVYRYKKDPTNVWLAKKEEKKLVDQEPHRIVYKFQPEKYEKYLLSK